MVLFVWYNYSRFVYVSCLYVHLFQTYFISSCRLVGYYSGIYLLFNNDWVYYLLQNTVAPKDLKYVPCFRCQGHASTITSPSLLQGLRDLKHFHYFLLPLLVFSLPPLLSSYWAIEIPLYHIHFFLDLHNYLLSSLFRFSFFVPSSLSLKRASFPFILTH